MARWNRALVTGASSGIGRAIAEQLAADGTELVLVARDEARLQQLADELDVDCEVLVADLAESGAVTRVEDRLRDAASTPIDLLVNNAGFAAGGPFHELDHERDAAVVLVNVVAVHRLAHAAAAAMVERGDGGGILNVSSIAGFIPAGDTATYAATKAFVTAFSEGLHAGLAPHGVHVTALCPGFTRTEFAERAGFDSAQVPAALWQSAADVAATGLAGVARNRSIVIPGAKNRVGAGCLNALPRAVRRFVVGRFAT